MSIPVKIECYYGAEFIYSLEPGREGYVDISGLLDKVRPETIAKIRKVLDFQVSFLDLDYKIDRYATPSERDHFDALMDDAVQALEQEWADGAYKIVLIDKPEPNPFGHGPDNAG